MPFGVWLQAEEGAGWTKAAPRAGGGAGRGSRQQGQGWPAANQLLMPTAKRRDIVAGCRTATQRAKHIFSLNGFNETREKEIAQRVSTKRERGEQHNVPQLP